MMRNEHEIHYSTNSNTQNQRVNILLSLVESVDDARQPGEGESSGWNGQHINFCLIHDKDIAQRPVI